MKTVVNDHVHSTDAKLKDEEIPSQIDERVLELFRIVGNIPAIGQLNGDV